MPFFPKQVFAMVFGGSTNIDKVISFKYLFKYIQEICKASIKVQEPSTSFCNLMRTLSIKFEEQRTINVYT